MAEQHRTPSSDGCFCDECEAPFDLTDPRWFAPRESYRHDCEGKVTAPDSADSGAAARGWYTPAERMPAEDQYVPFFGAGQDPLEMPHFGHYVDVEDGGWWCDLCELQQGPGKGWIKNVALWYDLRPDPARTTVRWEGRKG